jgi:flagellar motor protein MotB
MRNSARRAHHEDEEESAFVSMTDMTVSFLFVVMILLAFFATKLSDTGMVPRRDYDQVIEERNDARQEVAEQKIKIEELQAKIDELLARIDDLEGEKADLERSKAALEQKNAELEQKNTELEQENTELEAENARLKALLQSPLEKYLAQLSHERYALLERLRTQLRADFPDLRVEISAEGDALRFQGEGLFRTNESILYEKQRRIVSAIAARLDDLLPCYTLGPLAHWSDSCNPGAAVIEAVQIEGHTDSDGTELANLTLSTNRANTTFATMLDARPDLTQHQNYRGQPVLSVAGYGQMRPVASNATEEGKRTNRRIDLRIIMYTPTASDEIARIRAKLSGEAESAP